MTGFGIDQVQAEFVAEIKLRHLNREYILKRTNDIDELESDIAELEAILASKSRVKTIIVKELKEVADKYGQDRRSKILYIEDDAFEDVVEEVPDYPVHLFFTKEGYFKKITPQSLRMSGEQKLKEGDSIALTVETTNNTDLLFFTNKCQVYKSKAADFSDTKASVLGDYVPAKLQMDEGETTVAMICTKNYEGIVIFAFENGKIAKVPLNSYATKTNRKRLTNAYSDKSPLADLGYSEEECEFLITSSAGRMLLLHTASINLKTSRTTQGVAVMKLKKGQRVMSVNKYKEGTFSKPSRYRTRSLPALGAMPDSEDTAQQLSLI